MTHLSYPFSVDTRGRTAATSDPRAYVRQLVESVLFTTPGERVNDPEFGAGLLSLLFLPNSDAQRASSQILVQSALQRVLSDLLVIEDLRVRNENEGKIVIDLTYRLLSGGPAISERVVRAF